MTLPTYYKSTNGNNSKYYLSKQTSLNTGAIAIDGSTGEVAGAIHFLKPQKDVQLCFTPTTTVTGAGALDLLNSDDEVVATLVIATGAAVTQVGTATYPVYEANVLPAGDYNVSVKTTATAGDGTVHVYSKEGFDEDVSD